MRSAWSNDRPDRPGRPVRFAPRPPWQLVALGTIWGVSALLIKLVVQHVPPLWLVTGRVWTGLAVTLLLLGLRRQRLPASGRVWWHLVVLGTLGTAVPWLLATWAQQSLSASLGAVLAAPTPATTLALAAAAGVERITRRRVLGLLAALAGTLAIVGSGLDGGGPLVAVLVTAGTTVLFSFGTVYTKRYLTGVPGITVATGQLIASAVFVLPITLLVGEAPGWGALPLGAWILWLILGAVSTGLAYVLFYGLVDRVGPSMAQAVSYLSPPVGAVVGWVVLHESLGLEVAFGSAVMLAGVWLSQSTRPLPATRRLWDRVAWVAAPRRVRTLPDAGLTSRR